MCVIPSIPFSIDPCFLPFGLKNEVYGLFANQSAFAYVAEIINSVCIKCQGDDFISSIPKVVIGLFYENFKVK